MTISNNTAVATENGADFTSVFMEAVAKYPMTPSEQSVLLNMVTTHIVLMANAEVDAKAIAADNASPESYANTGQTLKACYDALNATSEKPLMFEGAIDMLPRVGNLYRAFRFLTTANNHQVLPEVMANLLQADVEVLNPELKEVIARAVEDNNQAFLNIVADSGIGLNEMDDVAGENGITPLMQACRDGNFVEAANLIALGADVKARDEEGFTALHHAVMYSEAQLAEINQDAKDRSEETIALMQNKAKIVKALLRDRNISIDDRNNEAGKAPFQIAVEQGMKTEKIVGGQAVNLLYGDHETMKALLEAGADPVFGQFQLTYKAKTAITVGMSIALTFAKNAVIKWSGIGFVAKFALSPALRLVDYALDLVVAYKGFLDAHASMYTTAFSRLAKGVQLDLNGQNLIGAVHTNWYGKVAFGESLKSYMDGFMQKQAGYNNIGSATFTADAIKQYEDGTARMTNADMIANSETLYARYFQIQEALANNYLAPWTREGYEAALKDIEAAFDMMTHGTSVAGLSDALREVFSVQNQAANLKAMESPENMAMFNAIQAQIKTGALVVDMDVRYKLEKFEQELCYPGTNSKSLFERARELASSKDAPTMNFAEFTKHAKEMDLEAHLNLMGAKLAMDLRYDADVRTFGERARDAAAYVGGTAIDKALDGLSWATGASHGKVAHVAAEVAGVGAGVAGGAAHAGFREFYDSWKFTAAVALCVVAKYPKQSWAAAKFSYTALKTGVSTVYSVAMFTAGAVKSAINFAKDPFAAFQVDVDFGDAMRVLSPAAIEVDRLVNDFDEVKDTAATQSQVLASLENGVIVDTAATRSQLMTSLENGVMTDTSATKSQLVASLEAGLVTVAETPADSMLKSFVEMNPRTTSSLGASFVELVRSQESGRESTTAIAA